MVAADGCEALATRQRPLQVEHGYRHAISSLRDEEDTDLWLR